MPLIFLRKKRIDESDEELLRRFREEGDIESLGLLYQKYMHLVYGVCLKYLESREEAKDEVMNIFEKLVSALPGQDIGNFRTWLYVVTKNHCLMLLRSMKREEARREMMISDPTFFMEKESGMHPMEADSVPETERLRGCIEKLRDEQRKCIELFYYEGYGYKKICDSLGIEEKKVKSYIQNGKRNLRICIEAQDTVQGAGGKGHGAKVKG